jgi:peptide/nickel transport system substrate-binding protein
MSLNFLRFGAAALVAVSAISLAGCSASSSIQAGSQISIGEVRGLDSLNPDVASSPQAKTPNADLGQLTTVGFYTPDAAGNLVANTAFGTAKIVETFPFTVTYSLTGAATWSDGTKVDATDLLLSWLAASQSDKYGFHSVRATSGLRYSTAVPKLSTDLNSLTVQFTRPVTDWRTAIYPSVAAHLVTQRAFPNFKLDARAAKSRFVQAVNTGNNNDLTEIAKQYSGAFSLANGNQVNTKNLVGAGPYLVASADANAGVKLTANPAFTWGNQPRVETVNVHYYDDALAMIADIQIGKLDVAAPAESGAAQIQEIQGLAKKADLHFGVGLSQNIDTVQLNLRKGSVFADASSTKAAAIRKAFLLAIPVGRIAAAINTDYPVQVAKSFFYTPDEVAYPSVTKQNGSSIYAFQNLEQASQLLNSVGVNVHQPVTVRVLFDSTNPRETAVWGELSKVSKQIGFELVNTAVTDPLAHLAVGDYDAIIVQQPVFGQSGFAGVESVDSSNFGQVGFDALAKDLGKATKASAQKVLAAKLDASLFDAGYGLPLYQTPTMVVYSRRVSGVSLSPFGNSAVWGYWNWHSSAK